MLRYAQHRLRVCPYEVMHVKDPRQVERSL